MRHNIMLYDLRRENGKNSIHLWPKGAKTLNTALNNHTLEPIFWWNKHVFYLIIHNGCTMCIYYYILLYN